MNQMLQRKLVNDLLIKAVKASLPQNIEKTISMIREEVFIKRYHMTEQQADHLVLLARSRLSMTSGVRRVVQCQEQLSLI